MATIITLGGSGFIGSAFTHELQRRGLDFLNVSRANFDYTNPSVLNTIIKAHKPEFLINAAGFTGFPNVDACEIRKADTIMGNVVLPAVVAKVCKHNGVPFGHVSSGCVYAGHPEDGYRETDPPNFSFGAPPCSFYSGTKALSEEVLKEHQCYLWRVRIPFDETPHPKNYLTKLLTYETTYDNVNSLSHRGQAAAAMIELWLKRAPFGIYHVTNPGKISTRAVCEILGGYGIKKDFKFFRDDADFYRVAKTPRSNCFLNTDKLQAQGIFMSPIQNAVADAALLYAHHLKDKKVSS